MQRDGSPRESAYEMKLFEHPDFEQAILRAEEYFRSQGLRAVIIEKDYYVTEALRIIAANAGDKVIFKGGTSLSKGWNLIQRFSEDIDLFLDPRAFDPPLGRNAINRELKRVRDAISRHPGLTHIKAESQTVGGFGRNDRFAYEQRFGGPGELPDHVLLELGTASGRQPTAMIELQSYIAQFLRETSQTLGTEDEGTFFLRLLHFRRTFVEKLFAIHGKVEILKRDGRPIGTYARHYYDLYQLAGKEEITVMLQSAEYDQIKTDYDALSRMYFSKDYLPPKNLSFAHSEALFPPQPLATTLRNEYERQCKMLCYGPYPSWTELQKRFTNLQSLL